MRGQGLYVIYEHRPRGPWCPAFQQKESWGSLFHNCATEKQSWASPQEWVASATQSFEVTVSMLQNRPVQIGLRPALEHDFEYCRRLYFAEMRWIIDELRLDR